MANNPSSFLHRVMPTAHRRLLETILASELPKIDGDVLVLGAGLSPHGQLLTQARTVWNTDVELLPNVDQIADAHSLPFEDSSYDAVLAIEVFEHLSDPRKAADEIRRVLKSGGKAYISIPFLFHIHGDPSDYTRFTMTGIRELFKQFSATETIGFGGRIHVISDLITTSAKLMVGFRIFNYFLTASFLGRIRSVDAPTGYWIKIIK